MKKRYPPQSLTDIPGVGISIANDLRNIGIHRIDDLKGMDPGRLYELSNQYAGTIQDRCLLYVSAVQCTLRKRWNNFRTQKNSNGGIGRITTSEGRARR